MSIIFVCGVCVGVVFGFLIGMWSLVLMWRNITDRVYMGEDEEDENDGTDGGGMD